MELSYNEEEVISSTENSRLSKTSANLLRVHYFIRSNQVLIVIIGITAMIVGLLLNGLVGKKIATAIAVSLVTLDLYFNIFYYINKTVFNIVENEDGYDRKESQPAERKVFNMHDVLSHQKDVENAMDIVNSNSEDSQSTTGDVDILDKKE